MRTLCSLGLVLLAACPGEAPPPVVPDAGEAPIEGQRLSGKTMDYFDSSILQGTALATDGIVPPLDVTSDAQGAFAFEAVPVGSQLFFSATRTNYRPTRNMAVTIAGEAVVQDVYLVSNADTSRLYGTDGKTPTTGRALVIAELQRNNGMPLVGIPLTDVQLVDGANTTPAGVIGPYLMTAQDINPAATVTAEAAGKVRVAFLDVPAGTFSLKVTAPNGQGQPQTNTTSVTTVADGATMVRSGGMGTGASGGMGTPLNPKFAQDIYPRLQTAANGGLACANCHTIGGVGAIAVFNALASDVLLALKAKTGLIDLTTPANSLLLTKPLYETTPPQNHPNATFVDVNDANYKLILLWIQQGAL